MPAEDQMYIQQTNCVDITMSIAMRVAIFLSPLNSVTEAELGIDPLSLCKGFVPTGILFSTLQKI